MYNDARPVIAQTHTAAAAPRQRSVLLYGAKRDDFRDTDAVSKNITHLQNGHPDQGIDPDSIDEGSFNSLSRQPAVFDVDLGLRSKIRLTDYGADVARPAAAKMREIAAKQPYNPLTLLGQPGAKQKPGAMAAMFHHLYRVDGSRRPEELLDEVDCLDAEHVRYGRDLDTALEDGVLETAGPDDEAVALTDSGEHLVENWVIPLKHSVREEEAHPVYMEALKRQRPDL